MEREISIRKKSGHLEEWQPEKIAKAIQKSADRIAVVLTPDQVDRVVSMVKGHIENYMEKNNVGVVNVEYVHGFVEMALKIVDPSVAESYMDYRNWVKKEAEMNAKVWEECQALQFIGDKSNANADSAMVSTKRVKKLDILETAQYRRYFLYSEEKIAEAVGYIYIHDKGARQDTMNCCLFDASAVLSGGFEMGNMWYNEPKTLDTAFDVIGDIVLMAASQQYGGFTLPEVDKILEPYAKKSFDKYKNEIIDLLMKACPDEMGNIDDMATDEATEKVIRDIEQGFQGWEYKFNTVASSRGDYPFITITLGINNTFWGKEICKAALRVRGAGQGKTGHKKPVLFPKLVFLYDENLHGPSKPMEDVFEEGIKCSAKCMYPDWLSLTGEGYVPEMYKKYGRVVSPMGCVSKDEVITYKIDGILYVESFGRAWERISKDHKAIGQRTLEDPNLFIDLSNANVTIYDTKKNGFVKVNKLIRNTGNQWVNVTLSCGRVLTCTTDHPFETENRGQVYAKDLNTEDKLMVNLSQYAEETISKSDDYAWFLGMMLCDGCYDSSRIVISIAVEGEDDIEERFKIIAPKFGYDSRTIYQERGEKGTYKDVCFVPAYGVPTLKEFGDNLAVIFGGRCKMDRCVPSEVFSWNREAKLNFLAGMIDADGGVNKTSHGGAVVQIGSTNKELAVGQMLLAQSLGMPARMYENHYKKGDETRIRWRVEFFLTEELANLLCEKKGSVYRSESHYDGCMPSNIVNVMKVEHTFDQEYSYDVSTDSEHFEVSGIYSHNCRAFLSPWYERGGMHPEDENDKPVFVGRFNIGVVSLNLPMIYAKSERENTDFFEELDYYLEMIRRLHLRTYDALSQMKASMNTLGFCEGGFYRGHLGLNDSIAPCLEAATASFGITALNELQQIYNRKSLVQDGEFALKVMEHIVEKINEFKEADGKLYAIYGTPAESLCYTQIKQFRQEFGIIENVSDRQYVSNSFHCHVTEKISPVLKQDLEGRFWNYFNGGKIQYCRYPIAYNYGAIRTLVRRAMEKGFYEGVNLSLAYCDDCGHEELEMDVCPVCGSRNLTKIDRMNGYLAYSRVHGDTRLNVGKMAEIADRVSM